MKIFIIGTGMDGSKTLTSEAEKAVGSADIIIGSERLIRPFAASDKDVYISYKPDEIAAKLNECGYSTAAVLMSGDCAFFSGTKNLLPLLKDHDVRIIAGISSVSYFCSHIGLSYENMKFITLHGRSSNIAVNVKLNEKSLNIGLQWKLTMRKSVKSFVEFS